jgi:anti-sigma factor RsiW
MNQELKVQALLDGELSKGEAALLEQQLASDPEGQRLLAELKEVKAAMIPANEVAVKVPDTRAFYWSQIQRRIEHEEKAKTAVPVSFITRWRRFLVPLAGVAGAAALLLVCVKQYVPASSSANWTHASNEMEMTTFHDSKADMTVVWLQDRDLPSAQSEDAND